MENFNDEINIDSFNIITNFIDKNLSRKESGEECLAELFKLSSFIKEQKLLDDTLFSMLLTNSTLIDLVAEVAIEGLNPKDLILDILIEQYFSLTGMVAEEAEELAIELDIIAEEEKAEDSYKEAFGNLSVISLLKRDMGHVPVLTPEEEYELFERKASGDMAARKQLILSSLRYVISIASEFQGRGVDFEDLIHDGLLGLIKGIEKFDHKKGFKLSTYATWWIRQNIIREIANTSKVVRIPVHMQEDFGKIRRAESALSSELFREPTEDEMIEKLGWPAKKYRYIKTVKDTSTPISLEGMVNGNGSDEKDGSELGSFLPIDDEEIEVKIHRKAMQKDVREMVDTLGHREKLVLNLRFGLIDGRSRTLDEISKMLRVTPEKIRMIEGRALRRLKYYGDHLKVYLDGDSKTKTKKIH